MKKFLIAALIFMAVFTAIYAQDAGQFTIGAHGGFGIGLNDIANKVSEIKYASLLYPAFGVFGAYTFMDDIGVQLELNFMISQGIKRDWELLTSVSQYTSLDIPVLFRYTFMNEAVYAGLLAGPHISLPLTKMEQSLSILEMTFDEKPEFELDGPTFGATAGIFVGYPMGPGSILGDVRFIFDFTSLRYKDVSGDPGNIMSRRAINIMVGYEMSF